MFQAQTISKLDVGLFESFEQPIEAKDNIPDAIDDPFASSRWFDVQIDNRRSDAREMAASYVCECTVGP